MADTKNAQPSLESLVESEDLGFEILHPGGLEITRELARLCGIQKGTYVLDVASGTGETACFLAQSLGARVVGIDSSAHMLQKAQDKARLRGLPVEFRRADAHELPFEDATFDAVISECTMCLLDKEHAIAEMLRVVKPGGRVGFHDICWKAHTPEKMKMRLAEIEGERPETLEGWKALCESIGLRDVRTMDRSALLSPWMHETTARLSLPRILGIIRSVIGHWGVRGLLDVWDSEHIFQSRHTGYGIVVAVRP